MGLAACRSAQSRRSIAGCEAVVISRAPSRVNARPSRIAASRAANGDAPSTSASSTASACRDRPRAPSLAATSRKVRSSSSQALAPASRAAIAACVALSSEGNDASTVAVASATGVRRSSIAVNTASVPSLPVSNATSASPVAFGSRSSSASAACDRVPRGFLEHPRP